jgi:hypothetical protein
MQLALLLIALGFGYKIFVEAAGQGKKRIKQIGQLVGGFIMLIALASSLALVAYTAKYGCPDGKGGWGKMCPFTGKPLIQTEMAKPR